MHEKGNARKAQKPKSSIAVPAPPTKQIPVSAEELLSAYRPLSADELYTELRLNHVPPQLVGRVSALYKRKLNEELIEEPDIPARQLTTGSIRGSGRNAKQYIEDSISSDDDNPLDRQDEKGEEAILRSAKPLRAQKKRPPPVSKPRRVQSFSEDDDYHADELTPPPRYGAGLSKRQAYNSPNTDSLASVLDGMA